MLRPQVAVCSELLEDRGAALLCAVRRLPALEDFEISFNGETEDLGAPLSDSYGLPRCKELAELHSHSLRQMSVHMLGGPETENMLRFGGLPALRSCELVGDSDAPLHMRIDAASFQGAPLLQRLSLHHEEGLQLQPGSLAQLAALTSLTLSDCGLQTVPVDLASLNATLCELDLSHNARLQIDGAAVAAVMSCSRLRTLSLFRRMHSRYPYELANATWRDVEQNIGQQDYSPAQFSQETLSHMLQMPSDFYKRYGRDLTVCITYQTHAEYLRTRSRV